MLVGVPAISAAMTSMNISGGCAPAIILLLTKKAGVPLTPISIPCWRCASMTSYVSGSARHSPKRAVSSSSEAA